MSRGGFKTYKALGWRAHGWRSPATGSPALLIGRYMCWSTEVTLAFVLLEMCCCAIIAAQGLHGLLFAFGPLVLQEVVQLLLWFEIDRHDPAGGGGACSGTNTALSFVELVLVCGLVPVGFALLAIRSLDEWQAALAAVRHGGLEPLRLADPTQVCYSHDRASLALDRPWIQTRFSSSRSRTPRPWRGRSAGSRALSVRCGGSAGGCGCWLGRAAPWPSLSAVTPHGGGVLC